MGKFRVTRSDIVRPDEMRVYILMAKDPRVRCVLAILGAFGKRICEVMRLRFRDIKLDPGFININFIIAKREPEGGILPRRIKKLSRKHYLAGFIIDYLGRYPGAFDSDFIFPSYGKDGHLTTRWARYELDKLSYDIWPHLFRTSLATLMGESGATAFELQTFFDWKSIQTASKYVRGGPGMIDKWASREF